MATASLYERNVKVYLQTLENAILRNIYIFSGVFITLNAQSAESTTNKDG